LQGAAANRHRGGRRAVDGEGDRTGGDRRVEAGHARFRDHGVGGGEALHADGEVGGKGTGPCSGQQAGGVAAGRLHPGPGGAVLGRQRGGGLQDGIEAGVEALVGGGRRGEGRLL